MTGEIKKKSPVDRPPGFQEFYNAYPRRVSPGRAIATWKKLTLGMDEEEVSEFTKKIVLAIEVQVRHRRQLVELNKFVPDWKHPATWLNGMCWMDELESISELKHEAQKFDPKSCITEGCGKPTLGPKYNLCARCYADSHSEYLPAMRDTYKANNLKRSPNETDEQYDARMRGVVRSALSSIKEKGKALHEEDDE